MAAKLGSADGAKIGIRDLAAVKNGLLILSGPEDDELGQAALFHLDPDQDRLTPLGKISGLPAEAKPEGLLVLFSSSRTASRTESRRSMRSRSSRAHRCAPASVAILMTSVVAGAIVVLAASTGPDRSPPDEVGEGAMSGIGERDDGSPLGRNS
jgi:hypothetical protein